MEKSRTRRVVTSPASREALQRGINQLADAIRPTLGPGGRTVAIARTLSQSPELLDDGAVIARRILALPDKDADMGAMVLRSMLWRLHEDVGDGTATAAVLFAALYNEGVRYLAAGTDPMKLRYHLEEGMHLILDTISRMAFPLQGKERLADLAYSLSGDRPLAQILGEVFDIIGGYGQLEIAPGNNRLIEREYLEGMSWRGGLLSRLMISSADTAKTRLENPAIVVSDLSIEQPEQLIPVLEMAASMQKRSLILVVKQLSERALALVLANNRPGKFQVCAVKTPGISANEQIAALQDLAIVTGARPFIQATGATFASIQPGDVGFARRAWATPSHFSVFGGKGNTRDLRRHMRQLQGALSQTEDAGRRREVEDRVGRLRGGAAILHLGGISQSHVEERQKTAQAVARAVRAAAQEGVVPGGGAALLGCVPGLERALAQSGSSEERAAYQMLLHALQTPCEVIIANAGYAPGVIMAALKSEGRGRTFDVRAGRLVDACDAGLLDVTAVLKAAVRGAVVTAALALTIEVLVHHRKPEEVMEPT